MARGLLLAIDQGTSNTKALLVDGGGAPVFRASVPVALLQPQAGFVEQDPAELWASVCEAIAECVGYAGAKGKRIEGIAISNQRETAVAWRAGLQPIGNAISWQCRRSGEILNRLGSRHGFIRKLTGLPVDPLVTAGKWSWLLEQQPELRVDCDLRLGTVDAWLLANLTGGAVHATDHSNASRTALLDLATLGWSEELCGLFRLPIAALPRLQASASRFGTCTAIAALKGVPIVAMAGDSHAALFGHGSYWPGAVKATYGTGSSLMMLTAGLAEETESLARTIAWSTNAGVQFALEGNVPMTGSAVQWVGEFLGLEHPTEDAVAMAAGVEDAGGVVFVPAMVGLGAPRWDSKARGTICNLERWHSAKHLARAALDAIAYQVADVFFAMKTTAMADVTLLRVDGGATRNGSLMQMQADLLGCTVERSVNEDLSALGAAWLGGITLGWWQMTDLAERSHDAQSFEPMMSAQRRSELCDRWTVAVARARLQGECL